MDNVKQEQPCASCESLKQMVRVLSALVDIQELPRGFSYENYKRLLAGKPVRLRKPAVNLKPKRRR